MPPDTLKQLMIKRSPFLIFTSDYRFPPPSLLHESISPTRKEMSLNECLCVPHVNVLPNYLKNFLGEAFKKQCYIYWKQSLCVCT